MASLFMAYAYSFGCSGRLERIYSMSISDASGISTRTASRIRLSARSRIASWTESPKPERPTTISSPAKAEMAFPSHTKETMPAIITRRRTLRIAAEESSSLTSWRRDELLLDLLAAHLAGDRSHIAKKRFSVRLSSRRILRESFANRLEL
jgi:hypothetical protein